MGLVLEGNLQGGIHGIIAQQSAEFRVVAALRQSDGEASARVSDDRCCAHASTSCWARSSVQLPRKKPSQPVRRCNATALTAPARWPLPTHRRRYDSPASLV